ncbi:hypothetical protein [Leptospira sp. B5-022]|uniref:hypothetical protein n=2 Tax=unclassified Leptospira TaxID=2633828 RepID=UPI00055B1040|nr:hypothetical protein [Leptospira sp. B5-022]
MEIDSQLLQEIINLFNIELGKSGLSFLHEKALEGRLTDIQDMVKTDQKLDPKEYLLMYLDTLREQLRINSRISHDEILSNIVKNIDSEQGPLLGIKLILPDEIQKIYDREDVELRTLPDYSILLIMIDELRSELLDGK